MASSKKIPITYLVFDDENDERNQNEINVKVEGVECHLIFVNPNDYWKQDTDIFEIEEFKKELEELLKGKHISLIASDWNLVKKTENYQKINALEIIKILVELNEKFKKTQYLIYSGTPKDVSQVLLSEIKNDLDSVDEPIQSKEVLSLLLEMKIKFCSRSERFKEINTLIKGSKTISMIVLDALSLFDANVVVNTGNADFDGKQIKSLLNLISQNDDKGLKFIREFIELSIAHYTKLNND